MLRFNLAERFQLIDFLPSSAIRHDNISVGFAEGLCVSMYSWWGVKVLTQRCDRWDNMGNNNPVSAVTSNQSAESSKVLRRSFQSLLCSLHVCVYAQYLGDLTTCTGNHYQVSIFTLPAADPPWSGDECCSCSVLVLASLFVKSVGGQYACFSAQSFWMYCHSEG